MARTPDFEPPAATLGRLSREAAWLARELRWAHGYPDHIAARIAAAHITSRRGRDQLYTPAARGVGQIAPLELARAAAEAAPVRAVRETVSPWLWILSIAGFAMAVVNYRRVRAVFEWARGRMRRRGRRPSR